MGVGPNWSLPELLALFSPRSLYQLPGPWAMPTASGAPQLRQILRLAKEGIREYNERLNALEKQVAQRLRDYDQCDPTAALRHRDEDDHYRDDDRRDTDEPLELTQPQIHHLFSELAIRRSSLNDRGFPYTSDVNEEQRRLYPDCESSTRREIEEAWDDWKNEDGKRLFRGNHRVDADSQDDERPLRQEPEHFSERDRSRAEGDSGQSARALNQEQFEAIFRRLRSVGAALNRSGVPLAADVQQQQREMFHHTRPASNAEIQQSFEEWTHGQAYRGRGHSKGDSERNEFESRADSDWKRDERRHRDSRALNERRQVLRVFDEILLNCQHGRPELTKDNLPRLKAVNQRLADFGVAQLADDLALQGYWIEYLVRGAKSHSEHHADHEVHPRSNGWNKPRDGRDLDDQPSRISGEVDLEVAVFEEEFSDEDGQPLEDRDNK